MEDIAFRMKVDAGRATMALLGAVVALVILSVAFQTFAVITGHNHVFGLIPLFDLDKEANMPAIFSAVLLGIAAGLLSVIAVESRRTGNRLRTPWAVLAIGFFLMAIDELASMHEKLVEPMRELLGKEQLGLLYFAWVVPALGLVAALACYFLPFLVRLPRPCMCRFLIAGAIYVGGALGIELAGGYTAERYGFRQPLYIALVTIEETMEMTGAVLFIRALLLHISEALPGTRVELRLS